MSVFSNGLSLGPSKIGVFGRTSNKHHSVASIRFFGTNHSTDSFHGKYRFPLDQDDSFIPRMSIDVLPPAPGHFGRFKLSTSDFHIATIASMIVVAPIKELCLHAFEILQSFVSPRTVRLQDDR